MNSLHLLVIQLTSIVSLGLSMYLYTHVLELTKTVKDKTLADKILFEKIESHVLELKKTLKDKTIADKILFEKIESHVLELTKTVKDKIIADKTLFEKLEPKIALIPEKLLDDPVAAKITSFKRVHARNFMFRYSNVLKNHVPDLIVLILYQLKDSVVKESCFSLSDDNILTIYIKVDKRINFPYHTPKLLILEEYKQNPYDLKSVKHNEIPELLRDLYKTDVNKGYFFTKNLVRLIQT